MTPLKHYDQASAWDQVHAELDRIRIDPAYRPTRQPSRLYLIAWMLAAVVLVIVFGAWSNQ